ncbi:MAG: restriction endonuclease subunit S [Candidatus Pacearchaeota archaeon]
MKTKQTNQSAIEWKEMPIGEVSKCLSGFAFESCYFNESKTGLPLIRIRDLQSGQTNTFYSGNYDKEYLVSNGDFLIGMDGEFRIHQWRSDKALLNQRVCKLIFDGGKIIPKYLYYLVGKKLKQIEDKTSFVTVKHISIKQILNIFIKIPFRNGQPDLETQKEIASILEKAEALKEKRKKSLNLLDEYLKSLFNELFVGKGFEEVELEKVTKIVSGSTPSTSNPAYWDGNINWVTPAELIDGDNYYYFETQRKITEEGIKSCSSELFPKGTVMLTTRAPIGKVAIAGKEMCSNQGFKNFIPSNKISSEYLYFWFLTNKDYLDSLGVGATFKEISKSIVSKIKIPLPPISLQQKFASIVEHVEKLKEKQQNGLREYEQLFGALMQKAFNGELIK